MERHAMVVNVVPELREEYLRLHSAVWPQVEATLTACNVANYSIYILEGTLFAYYEYLGVDHDADMERIGEDPMTQDWWTRTDPCQTPFGRDAKPSERWRDLREIWHLA